MSGGFFFFFSPECPRKRNSLLLLELWRLQDTTTGTELTPALKDFLTFSLHKEYFTAKRELNYVHECRPNVSEALIFQSGVTQNIVTANDVWTRGEICIYFNRNGAE